MIVIHIGWIGNRIFAYLTFTALGCNVLTHILLICMSVSADLCCWNSTGRIPC